MKTEEENEAEEKIQAERGTAALFALRSGISYRQDKVDQSPKSLRFDSTVALISLEAVAELLIKKGVITRLEYLTSLADRAERAVNNYESLLELEMGVRPKLR